MKKAVIYYFSGTGNTEKIVGEYKKIFENNFIEVQTLNVCVTDPTTQNPADFDLVGFAYPIYGFNSPQVMLDFAKKLDKCVDKNYFILKTSGEPLKINNASSLKMNSVLRHRGFNLTNEYRYIMPYNIMFRHSDAMVYKMWNTAQQLCKHDAKEIMEAIPRKLPVSFGGRLMSIVCRIEYPALKLHGRLFKTDKKLCNKCGKCIRECPFNNITTVDGFPKFGGKCVLCTKCAFYCPQNAVKMGLLNKWKVNGKYSFEKPEHMQADKHSNYCKKAYERYFSEAEQRLQSE